jgi:polyketide biosynthesis enoyl-CoA hydratase PksI
MAGPVTVTPAEPGIAVVAMADRVGRNTFTPALVQGLFESFGRLAADEAVKVVVVHGYDTIFLAGGTLDELLAIADGGKKFDEAGFFRLLLDCPLPVIAAMQGHALGGGLAFGLYADMVVLSRESLYATNFMKYGFTPGMGSTLLLPLRFGSALANEMLYSARSYHGGDLAQRGVGYPVVPRAAVIDTALALARDLADKPRAALTALKQTLTEPLRAGLPAAVEREKAMHELTFAADGIRDRIRDRFGR